MPQEVKAIGQWAKYNVRNIIKYHTENKTGRLVPDVFLFFKKALYKVKASSKCFSFNLF